MRAANCRLKSLDLVVIRASSFDRGSMTPKKTDCPSCALSDFELTNWSIRDCLTAMREREIEIEVRERELSAKHGRGMVARVAGHWAGIGSNSVQLSLRV